MNFIQLSIFLLLAFSASVNAGSCLEKTQSYAQFASARDACLASLNLTSADIPVGKDAKEHDKCLSKCTLESLGLFINGTLQDALILETFKNETTTEVFEKLEKIVEKCVEKANKPHDKKDKDGKEKKHRDLMSSTEGTMRMRLHVHRNKTCGCGKAAKFVYCLKEKDLEATC